MLFFLFLCCSFKIVLAQIPSVDTKALIIFNEKPYKDGMNKINPNDIEDINIVTPKDGLRIYGEAGRYGVILIITKQFMIDAFERRLARVSKEYRHYWSMHPQGENITYVLNGDTINRNLLGAAIILYPVTLGNFGKVDVRSPKTGDTTIKKIIVSITTNK